MNGQKEEKIVEMTIKPGMKAKTKFNFKGYGDEICPGRFQDVSFTLGYKCSMFKVDGSDLVYETTMDLKKYLRGESQIIALPGNRQFQINSKCIQNIGSENIFKGLGLPKRQEGGFGDLKIILKLHNASIERPINI